jgi:hypothetical protein
MLKRHVGREEDELPARKPPPPDEKPQFERFIETAREIGAGETDDALERATKKMFILRANRLSSAAKSSAPQRRQKKA